MADKIIGAAADDPGSATHATNYICLTRYQAEASDNLQHIKVKANTSINVKVAIYTDSAGQPAALLRSTGSNAIVSGWNTIDLTPLAITSGTYYWLAVKSGTLGGSLYNNASRTMRYKASPFADPWPDPAGTGYQSGAFHGLLAGWTLIIQLPQVQTNDADNIGHQSATLHGTLSDDGGELCDVRFQYGKTLGYGTDTAWQPGKVTNDPFEQAITGLDPDQTYHFRAQAKNTIGTHSGIDAEFETPTPPPPPITNKAQITHPALKTVRVLVAGVEQTSYDDLSNPDQNYLSTALVIPIPTPCTLQVTTLAGQSWEFTIPDQ